MSMDQQLTDVAAYAPGRR